MISPVIVSVIIRAAAASIARISLTIASIEGALGEVSHEFIILVDNDLEEFTRVELESIVTQKFHVVVGADETAGLSLNACIKETSGAVVILLDDCIMFDPDGLKSAICFVRENTAGMVLIPGADLSDRLVAAVKDGTLQWSDARKVPATRSIWASGSPIIIDRKSLLRVRCFDERMKTPADAFCDLKLRLKRFGIEINQKEGRASRSFVAPPVEKSDFVRPHESAVEITNRLRNLEEDATYLRNILTWQNRPSDAPPLVTVAIATFDRAMYLRDSINSVLMQTVQDFELIIVDDGSTDNTRAIVGDFDDERIKYIYQENLGIAAARNSIATISTGTFTAVHDDDDIMLPWRLETSLSAIKAGVQASYGSWVNFDNSSGNMALHVIRERFCLPVSLVNGQTPGHATWLVETRLIRQFRYNESISSAVDHNLALRMLRAGVSWVHTGKVLFLRRMHPTQVSNSDGKQQKYAAELSRFMLQFSGSNEGIASLMEESKSVRWPVIEEKEHLEQSFGMYLPDHLAVRRLHVQGNVANKASRLSKLKSTSFILCEEDETGKIVGEYADFLNVSLEDLAMMRQIGVTGKLEGEIDRSSVVSKESPAVILDRALRSRLQGITGSLKKRGKTPAAIIWTESDEDSEPVDIANIADRVRKISLSVEQDFSYCFIVYGFEDESRALEVFVKSIEGRSSADLGLYRRHGDGLDSQVSKLSVPGGGQKK